MGDSIYLIFNTSYLPIPEPPPVTKATFPTNKSERKQLFHGFVSVMTNADTIVVIPRKVDLFLEVRQTAEAHSSVGVGFVRTY